MRAKGADVVDAANTIVMPGFVDAHRHLSRSLARSDQDASRVHARRRLRRHAAGLAPGARGGRHDRRRLVRPPRRPGARRGGPRGPRRRRRPHDAGPGRAIAGDPRIGSPDVDEIELDAWAAMRGQKPAGGSTPRRHAAGRASVAELGRRGTARSPTSPWRTAPASATPTSTPSPALGAAVVLTPASDMARRRRPAAHPATDRPLDPARPRRRHRRGRRRATSSPRCGPSSRCSTPSLFDLKLAGKSGIPNLLGTRDVIRYATIDGARAAGLGGCDRFAHARASAPT